MKKEMDKIVVGKQNMQTEFSLCGLELLKANTESLSKEIEEMKVQCTQADEQVSAVFSLQFFILFFFSIS